MALVHEGLGQDELARREQEKAIYLDGGFAMAHFRLACLHDRAERNDLAMRGFRNPLRVLPDDDEQRVRWYSGGFDGQSVMKAMATNLRP